MTDPRPRTTTLYRSCTLCEAACGLKIESHGQEITSIAGDPDDPMSRGHICPKAAALAELHHDPDRLRRPLKRTGDDWVEMTWDEAFDLVAHRLRLIQRAHGRDAIGVFQGNPTVHNLGLLTYGQLFLRRLGTRNLYSSSSADQLPHMLSSQLMLGTPLLLPVPDVDRTSCFLMLGANPLVSGGSLMTAPGMRHRLRALRERGGRLVVIDPRRTETAAIADRHHFIEPGTDALLLLALLHTLFEEALTRGLPSPLVRGTTALRQAIAGFSPEQVAASTGIAAAEIRQLARDFSAAESAVCYGRMGVSTQEFGGLCSWLINVINIVTGNFDRPGGAMFASPAVDLVGLANRIGYRGGFARWRSRVRGLPEFADELPAVTLAEEIESPGAGQIRALITCAGNPVLSIPNGPRLERALAGLDFMVSIDFYLNETTRHANVILPPTGPLEHDHYDLGLAAVAVRNFARYSPALFARGSDQRHDWEIALELHSRLATRDRFWGRGAGRVLRALGERVEPHRWVDLGLRMGPYGFRHGGLSLARVAAHPHGIDLGPLVPRLTACLATADHKIHLAPRPYLDDLRRLRRRWLGSSGASAGASARTATGAGARTEAGANATPNPSRSLSLIGRRQLRSSNTWLHNLPGLVSGKPRCTLLIHPDDAAARGIASGDTVEIASRIGTITAPAEVSDQIRLGVVSLPHGWGHHRPGTRLAVAAAHPGVSANDITDELQCDEMSGNASFSAIPVEVRRLASSN